MTILPNLPTRTGRAVGPRPQGGYKYPWQEWTDGQPREAVRGVDYTCPDNSFRTACHQAARIRGLRVAVRITESGVAFQFYRQAPV